MDWPVPVITISAIIAFRQCPAVLGSSATALGNGPWPTDLAGGIAHPFELACDFDQLSFCKWRNELNDGLKGALGADWALYERLPAPADTAVGGPIVHAVPRGVTGVGDKFIGVSGAAAGISRSAKGGKSLRTGRARLVSDAVPCQVPIPDTVKCRVKCQVSCKVSKVMVWDCPQAAFGSLAFALWSSGHPSKLRVCTRRPPGEGGKVKCMKKVDAGRDSHTWAARQIDIPASEEPFEIILEARVKNEADVLALDKIVYVGDNSCDKNRTKIHAERPIGLEPIVPINAPTSAPIEATIVRAPKEADNEEEVTDAHDVDDEDEWEQQGEIENAIEDVIDWDSALRRPDGVSDIDWEILKHNLGVDRLSAQVTVATSTESPTSLIDPNRRQVLPELLSKEFGLDLTISDTDKTTDNAVDYFDYGKSEKKSYLNEVAATAAVECASITCGFEQSLCDYEAYRLDTKAGILRFLCHPLVAHKRFRDPPQGLCFLAVRTSRDVPVMQILASRPFTLPVEAKVHFRYFLPNSGGGQITVCVNSLEECAWSAEKPRRGLELWWQHSVALPAGRSQLFFVLTQWSNGTLVGLDDVHVELLPKGEFGVGSVACVPPDDFQLHTDELAQSGHTRPLSLNSAHASGSFSAADAPPRSLNFEGLNFTRAPPVHVQPGQRFQFNPLRQWDSIAFDEEFVI